MKNTNKETTDYEKLYKEVRKVEVNPKIPVKKQAAFKKVKFIGFPRFISERLKYSKFAHDYKIQIMNNKKNKWDDTGFVFDSLKEAKKVMKLLCLGLQSYESARVVNIKNPNTVLIKSNGLCLPICKGNYSYEIQVMTGYRNNKQQWKESGLKFRSLNKAMGVLDFTRTNMKKGVFTNLVQYNYI